MKIMKRDGNSQMHSALERIPNTPSITYGVLNNGDMIILFEDAAVNGYCCVYSLKHKRIGWVPKWVIENSWHTVEEG